MKLKILKKCLAAGLAVLFFCLCFTTAFAGVTTVYLGDANRDGDINASDARLIIRLAVGLNNASTDDLTVCDVDGDGAIGSSDARIVLRVTVGIENLYNKIVTVGEEPSYIEDPPPVTEPAPTEPPVYVTIDAQDLEWLAIVICQEAGGESTEMQMMVANVVINRVNSPYFPDTIYGVLTQKWQYARVTTERGIYWPSWAGAATQEQCRTVALRILSGERVCPDNVVYQAGFRQGSGIYTKMTGVYGEEMYFCYL